MTDFPWLTTLGAIPLVGSVVVAALPKGRELLANSGLKITPALDLNDAARKAVAAVK